MTKRSNKAQGIQPLRFLRFAISPQAGAALLSSLFIRRIAVDQRETEKSTVYYDTGKGALRQSGLLLALTRSGAGNVQSLERASNHPEAGFAPPHGVLPVEGDEPALSTMHSQARAGGLSCPDLEADELHPLLTLRFRRRRLLVKWRGSLFRIIHDHGKWMDGATRNFAAPFSEIVLQQNTGTPESFFDLALALCDRTDWRQIGLSRCEIGLSALDAPLRPGRRKARPCVIGAKESSGRAFTKIMEESLAQFLANDPAVIGDTAEAVHQSRVAIRRLRAGLRAFKPALPPRERQAFNTDLRWLQQSLGKSRDWHVFQTETLPAIAGLDDTQRKSLDELASRQQASGLAAAMEALASRRATRLILCFQRWLHTSAERDSALDRPVEKRAAKLARKSYRRLAAAGALSTSRPMAEIHAIRIRGKQLRYALEFFASLKTLAPYMPALPALKTLQTHLGNANDAAVALRLLSGDVRTPLTPAGRNTLERWAAARIIDCVEDARPALARIRQVFEQ